MLAATVVDSQLEEKTRQTGDPETPAHSTWYMPHITWKYTVGGKTYTDEKRSAGADDEEEQQEIVDTSPEGETVEVQYDPADPAVSFLKSVPDESGAKMNGVTAGILLVIGLVLLVFTPL